MCRSDYKRHGTTTHFTALNLAKASRSIAACRGIGIKSGSRLFSSTHNTIACSGGSRYRPTTLTSFSSKCGSLETLNVFTRCGSWANAWYSSRNLGHLLEDERMLAEWFTLLSTAARLCVLMRGLTCYATMPILIIGFHFGGPVIRTRCISATQPGAFAT